MMSVPESTSLCEYYYRQASLMFCIAICDVRYRHVSKFMMPAKFSLILCTDLHLCTE